MTAPEAIARTYGATTGDVADLLGAAHPAAVELAAAVANGLDEDGCTLTFAEAQRIGRAQEAFAAAVEAMS